jgi:autotransporter-associated beta strand protein
MHLTRTPTRTPFAHFAVLAAAAILFCRPGAAPAQTSTYTGTGNGNFSNVQLWNFGAGPIPSPGPATVLNFQTFGTGAITAADDVLMTLGTLQLNTYGTGALTLSSTFTGPAYSFTGAGQIQLLGSGATTTLSANVNLASTATGLTFTGSGGSGLTVSSVISSSTAAGAPLTIATTPGAANIGVVTLSGVNTFSGGVVLNSGTLAVNSTLALGALSNTLTVNGGNLFSGVTTTLNNNVVLNATLNYTNTAATNLTLTGVLSGAGGVNYTNGATSNQFLNLQGVNTYTGQTTIGMVQYAGFTGASAGTIHVQGAVGSVLNTSAVTVRDGGTFEINLNFGNSITNTRVSTSTPITLVNGFLQVVNSNANNGIWTQNLGTLTGSGAATILANANTATGPPTTIVNVNNLVRSGNGTVVFTGNNMGTVAPAAGTQVGSIFLTQVNGAAPSMAGLGTTSAGIFPWALADVSGAGGNFGAGTGFATYDPAFGVRLLNTTTEYNNNNDFSTAGATENVRLTAAPPALAANATVGSVFNTGAFNVTGTGFTLTITSGALAQATGTSSTISSNVSFGAGGTGEGVVSVIGGLAATNSLTISGNVTAGSLTKASNDTLILTGTNTITGPMTVNGGWVSVPAVSNLGGPTSLTFNMPSFSSNGGLIYTGSGTDTLTTPITVNAGHAQFNVSSSTGVLNLNSNIGGAGGINPQGTGTLVLGGTNTFTGGMRIGTGTTVFSTDANLGAPSSFITVNGGSVRVTGTWTTARNIGLEGTLTFDTNGNNSTWSGPITGSGAITQQNAGVWTIAGANNPYTGTITLGTATLAGGTLALSGSGDLNSASVVLGVAGTPGTPTLDISGASGARDLVSLTGIATSQVLLGTNNLRVGAGTFSGVITSTAGSGQGALIKVGTGTLTLNTGTNTYEGGTQIWGGTLAVDADARLGILTTPVVLLGGAFNNTATLTTARNFTLGNTFFPTTSAISNTFNTAGGTTLTLTGNITGAGGFQKITATGTLILAPTTGGNTYAGDTQITAGTLAFTADNQIGGATSRVLMNGGTLSLASGAGAVATARTVIVTAASTLDVSGTSLELDGPVLGTAALTKTGTGALVVGGANPSYFGTLNMSSAVVPAGTVSFTAGGTMPRATINLTTNSAATFDMSNLTRELGGLSTATGTSVQLGTSGGLTVGFSNAATTVAGNVLGGANASLVKVGTGTLTITGNGNTFAGGFQLLFGSVTLSGNGALPLQSAMTVGGWANSTGTGSTLTLDNSTTAVSNRIDPNQDVFSNGATWNWTGNATTLVTQNVKSLRGGGYNTVSMTPGTAGSTLSFTDAAAGLTRVNRGTFLFRGTNLGATPGAGNATLLFGNLAGTYTAGSTTNTILPFAVGGTTTADTGSTFVAYDTARGVVPLSTATDYAPAFATPTDNVLLAPAAATTFTASGADLTANSLVLAQTGGTILINSAAAERLVVTSGAVLNTAANVYAVNANGLTGAAQGIQTAEIQTGSGNSAELVVFATADLALGAKVTTTGGLTKSGGGILFLTNAANTYTGGTTITAGSLAIDSFSALGGNTGLTMSGGYLRYRGPTTNTSLNFTLGGGSANNPGLGGGFYVASGTTLGVGAGALNGPGGLYKDGTGVLALTGTNTYAGATILQAGAIALDNPNALGTYPRLVIDSGAGLQPGASVVFNAPMTFAKDVVIASGTAAIGAGFDTNGNNVTLSGTVSGASSTRGLYKFGAGILTLTATELYTGATGVYGGTLTLAGPNGAVVNSQGAGGFIATNTVVVNPGAALVLDNTAANNNNRLPNVLATPLGTGDTATAGSLRLTGGELKVIGNAAGTAENANRVEINIAGTVTLVNNGANTSLDSGRIFRANSSTAALIRGDNLGATPGPTSTNWFAIDLGSGSTGTVGPGGAKGTPFISIIPGFVGDASSSGVGTDLVTYDPSVGVRLLTAAEYATSVPANGFDPNRAPNLLANAPLTVNSSTMINALKLAAGGSVGGPGNLTVTGSTILATATSIISVPNLNNFSNGVTGPGGGINAGWDVLVTGAGTILNVSSSINGNASPLLNKYGNGTLVLSGSVYGTGGIVAVSQGTLLLNGPSAAINPVGVNLTVLPGATFDLGGSDRTVAALNTAALIGAFNYGQKSDGTVALGSSTLTLYDNVSTVFTGQITGTAASGLTKGFFSASTTTITQPQPGFAGTVRVNNGTLVLAGAGTLPAAGLIDVRGGTLLFNNQDDGAAAGGQINQRVSAAAPINLAGTIQFNSNTNAVANHALGQVNLVGGGQLTVLDGGNAPTTVTVANLSRAANKGTLVVTVPVTGVSGFGGTGTGWTINGSATFPTANQLQLTANAGNTSGSGWFNTPVSARSPWTMSFTYTVAAASATPADGFTVGFQSLGLNALASTATFGGGGLGYQGTTPSAAVAFNIFPSNTSGGVGSGYKLLTNGQAPGNGDPPTSPVNAGLVNSPVNVTLTYDGTFLNINMVQGANTFNTGPLAFNLGGSVGQAAYIGFTGASGGSTATQQITNFVFNGSTSNFGLTQAANSGTQVLLTQVEGLSATSALVGGGGAAGTTTVSILPWAWATTNSFLTYDPANGLRPLNTASEYLTTLPVAASNDNVRLAAGAVTLPTGNTEMNSLIQPNANNITGAAGAASTLTVRSGALAFTAASAVAPGAGGTLALNFGPGNTAEAVIFNSAAVTLGGVISTTGGVTKFGGGTLTLAGANTFTGGLTINGGTVAFTADNNLGAAGGAITFGIPTNSASPNGLGLQYTGTAPFTLTRNLVTNSFGGVLAPVAVPLTLNGTISGPGAFAFNLAGSASSIYEVNGTNTYQGDTYLNFGQISIASDAAFGSSKVIQINSGTSTDGIDLRADWTTSRTIHMRSAGDVNTNGFNATLNGPIVGSATLTKNNNGTLTLTAASPYTGVLSINAGEVRLFNQGAFNSTGTQAVGFGATLTLDDTGTHYSGRLPQTGAVTLNNGTFRLLGNSSVTTEETFNNLSVNGVSTVTLTPGAGQAAILRLGSTAAFGNTAANGAIVRSSASTAALFRGTNLGTAAPGTPGVASLVLVNPFAITAFTSGTNFPAFIGGGGPSGSTAVSIIPAAFGDTSSTGFGTQLVTYDPNRGVRLLNPATEYATTLPNGVNVSDNVHLTSPVSLANATTINALWLDNGGGTAGSGTLTITTGTILVTGTGNTIAGNIFTPLATGSTTVNTALVIGGPGDLTITSTIPASNSLGLDKLGAGTLFLPGSNSYTGTTVLHSGTIAVGSNSSLGSGTLQIMSDDGTLAASQPGLTLSNAIGLSGTLTIGGTNDLTLAGNVAMQSAARTINVASGLNVTVTGVISASNTGIAGNGLTKAGGGTLILTGANTYGNSGTPGMYLTQTVVNAGELRVNNGAGSGTGGSTVVVNTGATLSGTGFIIPTQLLTARNTVTVNGGGKIAPGLPTTTSNPGTLTIGSGTTPGVNDATVTIAAGGKFGVYQNVNNPPVTAAANTGGSGPAGTANNLLTVFGSLTINPGAVVTIAGDFNSFPDHTVPYSFQVATATTIPTAVNITSQAQFDTTQFQNYVPGLVQFSLQSAGTSVYLNVVPVPEPSAVLAVCAAAGAAGVGVRRRRKVVG